MVENGAAASRLLPTPPPVALVAATADYTASPIPGIFHCRHHRRALAVSERCVLPSDYVTRSMCCIQSFLATSFLCAMVQPSEYAIKYAEPCCCIQCNGAVLLQWCSAAASNLETLKFPFIITFNTPSVIRQVGKRASAARAKPATPAAHASHS